MKPSSSSPLSLRHALNSVLLVPEVMMPRTRTNKTQQQQQQPLPPSSSPPAQSAAAASSSAHHHHHHHHVFATPSLADPHIRLSYEIARGEQGVLTFEPYKSILLPHWRFRTVPIAEESARTLKRAFDEYVLKRDFVGSDMARKFIQMGMTRAKRYANHKGGKKYEKSSLTLERERAAQTGEGGEVGNPNHSTLPQRTELPRSMGHAGQEEKLAASEIFKAAWRECTSDGAYLALKAEWQREKKEWLRAGGGSRRVKTETDDIDGSEVTTEPRKEPSIKVEGDDG